MFFILGLRLNLKMKYLLLIPISLFVACSQDGGVSNEQSKSDIDDSDTISDAEKNFISEYFFDFDDIDYYYITFYDTDSINNVVWYKDSLSDLEKFYVDVLEGYHHSDTTFIDSLDLINFQEAQIDPSKFKAINEIFKTKYFDGNYMSTDCIAMFRDILVFKKNSKIVGIAKICFSCDKHSIIGSEVSSEMFGQSGEYSALQNLLFK